MKVGLFIPCYVDQFYPQVGIATLQILEKIGLEVEFPLRQTCCGQPMANSGFEADSEPVMRLFVQHFKDYEYIVAPSGSCVLHVRERYEHLGHSAEITHIREKTFELCDFLVDVMKITDFGAVFPHKVGLHLSCHGQRGLRQAQSSEIVGEDFSKLKLLLSHVKGLELVDLDRKDECCGFGGTFCVSEEAVSARMGIDRVHDHEKHHAEVITGGDMSCLMHLEGIIRRQKKNIKVMHFAEILANH
ncbi:(Fe-S)-binding protein [Thermoflexibacter ruber]|uniref:L-lactate dehydrogenase complex protein LldE n=1 Tax=Thermoflexibacter ruber TaxID=1003 RepID=A0A1I2JPA6_9BACT|nr:(Fe-S)-binding protein [Thermoflexibacter ruber]SFF55763.1 L-lactate dehydrogenase complex protein LldE [Thermoflexibacter ruber]